MEPHQRAGDLTRLEDLTVYREIVGALQYIAVQTRPDIAHTVSLLSRNVTKPTRLDWQIAKQCIRYLKGTQDFGIRYYSSGSRTITAFSDANFAGDSSSYRSTTAQVIMLASGPIAWKSKLQKTTVTSITEAEYFAVASTIKTVKCIRNLGIEIGLSPKQPVDLFCDNSGAVLITTDEGSSQRTRHLGAQLFYARENSRNGTVKIKNIEAQRQLADMMTKTLGASKFRENRSKLVTNVFLSVTLFSLISLVSGMNLTELNAKKVWLPTKNLYASAGSTLVKIGGAIPNQCEAYSILDTTEEFMKTFKKYKNNCITNRRMTFDKTLGELEKLSVKNRPRRAAENKEATDDFAPKRQPVDYASGMEYLWSIVPFSDNLRNFHDPSSPRNMIATLDRDVLRLDIEVRKLKREFEKQVLINNKTIQGQMEITRALNETIGRQHTLSTRLIQLLDLSSKVNTKIMRDTELLKNIIHEAKKGFLDLLSVHKLYPESESPSADKLPLVGLKTELEKGTWSAIYLQPKRSENISFYKETHLKNWLDDESYELCTSTKMILMVNQTNNCTKELSGSYNLQSEQAHEVHEECLEAQKQLLWPAINGVGCDIIKITAANRIEVTMPRVITGPNFRIIECFQSTITINNLTKSCGSRPYLIPIDTDFKLRGYAGTYDVKEIELIDRELDKMNLTEISTLGLPQIKFDSDRILNNLQVASKTNEEIDQILKIPMLEFAMQHPIETASGISLISLVLILLLIIICRRPKDALADAMKAVSVASLAGSISNNPHKEQAPRVVTNVNVSIPSLLKSGLYPMITESDPSWIDPIENGVIKRRKEIEAGRPPTPFNKEAHSTWDRVASASKWSLQSGKSTLSKLSGLTKKSVAWSMGSRNDRSEKELPKMPEKPPRFQTTKTNASIRSMPTLKSSDSYTRPTVPPPPVPQMKQNLKTLDQGRMREV